MSEARTVTIRILDREYLIACTVEEQSGLVTAASYFDEKMREIRTASRSAGLDRVAVMAGLNIAHELLSLKQHTESNSTTLVQHMQALKLKLDSALDASLK